MKLNELSDVLWYKKNNSIAFILGNIKKISDITHLSELYTNMLTHLQRTR